VLRAAERRFGAHDPVLAGQGSKKGAKDRLVRTGLETAGKANWFLRNAFLSPAVNLPRNTRLSTLTGRKNA